MPAAASASLSPISWVAIDLTLTTSSRRSACTSPVTIPLASLASRAQCTAPPRAVTAASSRSRCSSRCASACALIAAPASRSSSQSASSPTTAARLARIVSVAWPRLRRSWVSASAGLRGLRERRHPHERAAHRQRLASPGMPVALRRRRRLGPGTVARVMRSGRGQDLGQVHRPDARAQPARARRRCA